MRPFTVDLKFALFLSEKGRYLAKMHKIIESPKLSFHRIWPSLLSNNSTDSSQNWRDYLCENKQQSLSWD